MRVTPLCALISVGASEFNGCSHVLDEAAGIVLHFAGERAHGFEVEFYFGRFWGLIGRFVALILLVHPNRS